MFIVGFFVVDLLFGCYCCFCLLLLFLSFFDGCWWCTGCVCAGLDELSLISCCFGGGLSFFYKSISYIYFVLGCVKGEIDVYVNVYCLGELVF